MVIKKIRTFSGCEKLSAFIASDKAIRFGQVILAGTEYFFKKPAEQKKYIGKNVFDDDNEIAGSVVIFEETLAVLK